MKIIACILSVIATLAVAGRGHAQPYPQQPYPQQPYPQQPYPYPQQPYPQQPYPYPQQPYPQQPYPVPPPQPALASPDPGGFGYSLAIGGAGTRVEVDQGSKHRTWGGGVFFHGSASGLSGHVSGRLRLSAFLGGGGGGYEGAGVAHVFVGGGVAPSSTSQFFVRFGANAYALKNDEIEANTGSLPAVELGYQLHVQGFGFSVAPQGGLMGRTEYEPGDEAQGRRYARRLGTRVSAGGGVSLFTDYVFFDASFLRVLDSDPLTIVEGDLCVVPWVFAVCGFGQYWRSIATGPAPALDVRALSTTYLGISLGFGIAGAGARKFPTSPPGL